MAEFDPTQFGAVAVEEPPPQEAFDPTAHGAIPVQGEERSIPSKIGHAVLDTLKGFIPQSVEDAALAPVTMFPGVGQAYKSLSNIVSGRPASEGISPLAGIPVVQRIPEIIQAEKTPALSQERFTTAAGTLLDLSMIAGFKSALHPEIIAPKPLAEVAGIAKPETPMAAAVEPVPGVEPVAPTETGEGESDFAPFTDIAPKKPQVEVAVQLANGEVVKGLPNERTHAQIVQRLLDENHPNVINELDTEPGWVVNGKFLDRDQTSEVLGHRADTAVSQFTTKEIQKLGGTTAPVSTTAPLSTETPETIAAAAVRHGDGRIDTGPTHALITGGHAVTGEDGFVTNTGRFVDAKEAHDIAVKAKQAAPDRSGIILAEEVSGIQDQPVTTGEPNASKITSTTSVTQPEVRTQVGEGAPLRQQGETPETRQGTPQITQEAQDLIDKGGVPGFVSKNLERIATENGITDIGKKTPNQIIDELKAKSQPAPQAEVAAPTQTETAPPTESISEQPKTIPTPAETHALSGGEDPIGIAERYREEQQPGSVIPGVGRTADEARAWGHDFINKGGNPYDVVANKGTRRELWQDVGVVRAEYERLSNEKRVAESAMEANPNDAQARLAFENADLAQRKWSKDAQPVLTRAGDALRAASRSYPREINSFSDFTDIINDHFGGEVELTPEKRAELQKAVKAIKKGNVEATDARAKVTDAAVKKAGGKVMSFDDLKASLTNKMTKLLENCPT